MSNPNADFGERRVRPNGLEFDEPVHIASLEAAEIDPFHEEEDKPKSWLLTTCLAGIAGSLVLGGALLGLFSDGGSSARASIANNEGWQRPTVAAKSDLNGSLPKTALLQPYKAVSVAYQAGDNTSIFTRTTIRKKGPTVLTNRQSADTSSIPENLTNPTILGGDVRLTALQPTKNNTTIVKQLPPEPIDETIVLGKGETLGARLIALGITAETAARLTAVLEPVFPAKLLRAGQHFEVTLDRQQDFFGNFVIYPVQITFSPGPKEEITVESDDDGRFAVRVNGKRNKKPSIYASPRSGQYRIAGQVTSSLFAAAVDRGVPEYIINQMIRAFSHDVDFQRDVKAGAKFEIYFGRPLSGSSKRRMVIHYAALQARGQTKRLYRFTTKRGRTAYYDPKGRGATKFLMRTPISGARISSGYGMRRHPVLGYSKMHAGIDFAAPRGTPIRAAGAGRIIWRAWKGGYGRVVEIKHTNGYVTRYAHMSRYAGGLGKGSYVRQGQVIGYVGSSGRTTGAHLHYEVRINNRSINPRRVRVAGKLRLKGGELSRFNKHRARIVALMKKSPIATRFASLSR